MASNDLLAEREKIQRQILALENTLGVDSNIAELLSSDSNSDDDDDDESGPTVDGVPSGDLEAERQRIQREIEDLENTLGTNAALVDILTESEHGSGSSNEDSDDDDELDLPQNVETCLQMNLVYQEVLKEKLAELERLLNDNQQEQKQIEAQLSGPTTSNSTNPTLPPQKHFLGYFMKPYFKDKLTGLGPPANEETKERLSHGTRLFDELKIKRWEGWQKALLINGVITDTMKRMLQPKLSKLDYLSAKMSKAMDEEKEEMTKQVDLIEKEISEISAMKEDQLMGELHDDHDWEKISNIDFEGLRQAEDLKRFWQNYLHPSINKSVWKQDEIDKLSKVAQEYKCCHWDKIAEALGTNRTAFMCFQTYQRYISKTFKRKGWTKEEDEILKDLIEKMKIGNFIPYMQMSYFMVGRDASQLAYRWTSVLDPSIKKGPWSKEEDELLRNAVAKYGITEWWKIKVEVPGRTDGACRDRYLDCLRENVKKGPWTKEEIELLKQKVEKYGVGKWSKIASEIPNRLDCQCLYKWRKLTQFRKGTKRVQKKVPVQQKAKRRKIIRKNINEDIEITSGSEEEEQMKIEYMDSDAEPSVDEPDVPPDKDLSPEIRPKDYVQPDMKEWIPVNAKPLVCAAGTVRTMWVSLPTNEDEQKKSTKESTLGRIRSENSICPPMRPCLVRNTILNRFGNMERTYVGLDPIVLLSPADNENSMIKVPISDVKHFLQRKETSAMKKEKRKTPGDKKRRRQVQDWSSLNNDLLKAISPWIGNVILPVPANEKKFCEADIVGGRAANITLTKTAVFSFFVKTLHMDTEGCKNVIKVCKKKGRKMQNAEHIPKIAPPNTVSAMLQERKLRKTEHKEPAGPPQPPPPLQPVHVLNHAQQPVWQMTPTLVQPNTLIITQPNMQGAVQPLLLNVLPGSPPQIPLPLIKLTAPVQPTSTFSTPSKLPSTESSKMVRKTRRPRKPTEKFQALMEQAKTNVCKKELAKQNKGKPSDVVPTNTVRRQIKWILTPTGFVPVTGMLSTNIPDNQTLNMPNTSLLSYTTFPCTSTNSDPSSSARILPTSSCISTSNACKDPPMPPPPINITSTGNGLTIQMPTSTLVQNQSMPNIAPQMSSQAPSIVDQKGSFVHTEASQPTVSRENSSESVLDLSVSSSKETTAMLNLSHCPSMSPSVSSAVTNVISVFPPPTVLSKPTLVGGPVVSKPTDKVTVAKAQGKNACVPITAIQQPTIIQNQGLPITIVQPIFPHSFNKTLLQPLSSSSTVVVPSVVPQITKPSQLLIPNPVLPSKNLSFDPNLVFPDHSLEVDDWMNGKGGIPLPHLEVTLPYLPPSVASIKTLTSLLKVKQSLIANAAKILPQEYQTEKEEEAQVAAIRKLVAERFATNPAYQLCKARFLSCFTLPALLATINPFEECELPDEDEAEEMDLQKDEENDQPPAARTELNTNENEASAAQFSGISTKKQRRRRPVK